MDVIRDSIIQIDNKIVFIKDSIAKLDKEYDKKLNQYEIPVMDDKLYYKWLILNRKNFPYNFV